MFVRAAAGLAVTGIAAGLIVATVLTRVMTSVLTSPSPVDPATDSAMAVAMLATVSRDVTSATTPTNEDGYYLPLRATSRAAPVVGAAGGR